MRGCKDDRVAVWACAAMGKRDDVIIAPMAMPVKAHILSFKIIPPKAIRFEWGAAISDWLQLIPAFDKLHS